MNEQRMQLELRQAVDYYVRQGFEVMNRDPLTVQRGTQIMQVRGVGRGVAIHSHEIMPRAAMN